MSSNQICPQFITWRRIFAILDEAWRKKGNKKNPPPNVFNFQGWTKSSNEKKKELWAETLTWADKNGFKNLIPELYADDMFEGE
jgi:hypothetical protein